MKGKSRHSLNSNKSHDSGQLTCEHAGGLFSSLATVKDYFTNFYIYKHTPNQHTKRKSLRKNGR